MAKIFTLPYKASNLISLYLIKALTKVQIFDGLSHLQSEYKLQARLFHRFANKNFVRPQRQQLKE